MKKLIKNLGNPKSIIYWINLLFTWIIIVLLLTTVSCKTVQTKTELDTVTKTVTNTEVKKDSTKVEKQKTIVNTNVDSEDSTFMYIVDTHFIKDTSGIPFVVREIKTTVINGKKISTVQTVKDLKKDSTNVKTNKVTNVKEKSKMSFKEKVKEKLSTPMPFNIIAWVVGVAIVLIILYLLWKFKLIN